MGTGDGGEFSVFNMCVCENGCSRVERVCVCGEFSNYMGIADIHLAVVDLIAVTFRLS